MNNSVVAVSDTVAKTPSPALISESISSLEINPVPTPVQIDSPLPSMSVETPLTPASNSKIRYLLFSQPEKEILLPGTFTNLARNDSAGKSSGIESGKTRIDLLVQDNLRQYAFMLQAMYPISLARDSALHQASHDVWCADGHWIDELDKTKKRQKANQHLVVPFALDSILRAYPTSFH